MNIQPSNTFKNLPSDREVESRARALFQNACESADSYHTLRLGLARRKALNAGPARFAAWLWAPLAGGAVACCALAIGLAFLHPFANPQTAPTAATPAPIVASATVDTESTIDLDNTQVDMVQNLDFYRWLAAHPGSAPATSGGSLK
jgi:hypothetical protein